MRSATVNEIFSRLAAATPEPKTELHFTNHYTLLVAVVLSAQSTDAGVNRATDALFKDVDTPEAMVALGEDGVRAYIKTIGLFNAKAKNVIGLSERLIAEYNSTIPCDREALMSLPGVGRKTANVILNCAFGQPTMAVDTHVFRVSNRIGLVKTKTPDATEAALVKTIPARWMQHAHHWLILHGRYTCVARSPKCGACIIADLCAYKDKRLP